MRKLTQDELRQFASNLDNQLIPILNVAQIKAVLRLMRDEIGEDKDLLEYVNLALNQRILGALKSCVPRPQVVQPKNSVLVVGETSDDWLLKYLATKEDWVYDYHAAQSTIRLSECEFIDKTSNSTAILGPDYEVGVRSLGGVWIFLRKLGIWDAYCSMCSWYRIENPPDFTCPNCHRVGIRCVENELSNMR